MLLILALCASAFAQMPMGGVTASSSASPPSFVQVTAIADGTCGTTCSQAIGTVTSGNMLTGFASWQGSTTTITSITCSSGRCTCSTIGSPVTDGTNNYAGQLYSCTIGSTGTETINFNMSAGTFHLRTNVAEYGKATLVDTSSQAAGGALGTNPNGQPLTGVGSTSIVVSMISEYSGNGATVTAGSGWTQRGTATAFNNLEDKVVSGNVTPTWTAAAAPGDSFIASIAIKP